MLLEQEPRWLTQLTPVESEESKHERRKRRAYLACDLLLAKLFKSHPDHAIAALKGIEPRVIDLEPPPPPVEKPPTAEIIPIPTETMADLIGECPRMRTILDIVCKFYDVTPVDVCSDRRTLRIIKPRHVVMYFARKLTTNSTTAVGRILGGRDHSTVIHGARNIEAGMKRDERLADEIEVLSLHIKAATFKSS